jgi:hypothetical protein
VYLVGLLRLQRRCDRFLLDIKNTRAIKTTAEPRPTKSRTESRPKFISAIQASKTTINKISVVSIRFIRVIID